MHSRHTRLCPLLPYSCVGFVMCVCFDNCVGFVMCVCFDNCVGFVMCVCFDNCVGFIMCVCFDNCVGFVMCGCFDNCVGFVMCCCFDNCVGFVMCCFDNCVGFVMCCCFDNCVGVFAIRVLVFTVFCIVLCFCIFRLCIFILICYLYWLRAGQFGIESRWGRDFPPTQTYPVAHLASCKMGTWSFPVIKCGRGVLLTTHPLLVPLSWNNRAVPLPSLWATPGL